MDWLLRMKTLFFLVCCALVVKCSWCDGISIIGSKYIRSNRPYTVAFANPLNKIVKLKLSLQCDNDSGDVLLEKESKLQLGRTSGKNVQFSVPSIANLSVCTFSAINDGGEVIVDYEVDLEIPKKTVSIFIQTDKPVYKPGDVLRFRVVVVDIETKPVTNIKTIEVLIKDTNGDSVRQWTFAKLNKGIFESSYQMAAVPVLGTWTITVTVDDNSISNDKVQSFEVMEYVLPKFAVKAWPSKTLLIEDRKISLNIESHYTFGQRVEGKVQVDLYLDKYSKRSSHKTIQNINGKAVVEFQLGEELEVDEPEDHTMVKMTVAVTDSITNATVNITQQIPVYLKPYKLSLIQTSTHYRPGAPYHFKLSAKDHTGLPLEQGKTIKILVDGEETLAPLDGQGLASFIIPTPDDVGSITVSAEFDSVEYDNLGTIEGSQNSSIQYLQIHSKQRIIAGKSSSFTISSNEPIIQFTYFVVTRGCIVDFGHLKSGKRKTYALKLKLIQAMAPKATLVVFLLKEGKFVADYFHLNFESFGNDFEFKLDEESYRPDQDIYVEGKAQSDSIVIFQAIDQSALLLGHTEYGITKQGILDDLDQYNNNGEDNALDWFDSMGLFYRSDAILDASGSSRTKRSPQYHRNGQRRTKKPVLLRINFPEAWLWRTFSMNNRDTFEIEDLVPDTITSWYVTGIALSPSRGLGIMSYPRKFTVGKSFYMIAHLPYSIKRDEVALIQVTLYNFLGNTVTTDVTLFNKNDEIEFVEKSSKDDTRRSKAVVLPSHQVKPISFLIKAKKLGEIAIKIEAENDHTSDGLEHMLRVTPESRLYIVNEPKFIELQGFKNQSFNINCDIPRDADPGSTKIMTYFDHDVIGIPAKHSESLINIPIGSGDLNLLTLIPNIVALDYLSSFRSDADELIRQKAIDSLNKGYDNQLKYKSSNGAFRQWIPETDKESIFLTALVANAFVTASKYITVDPAVINDAFSWLAGKQKTNGCFEEVGEVLYSPMQDSSSSIALTAFVVAAIKENQKFSSEYKPLVDKAVECLAAKFNGLSNHHHIALATYALSLANHPKRLDYLNKLIEYSIRDGKERYWDEDSLSIEIAGYAVLSYIAQDLPLQAMSIYRWLNRQRYSSGEFAGVQSTFVGLKAMSKMAQTFSQSPVDYRVQIKPKSKISQLKTLNFHIDKEKALYVTEQELSDTTRTVQIDFAGTGYGFFQLTYQYHLNIGSAKQSFDLTIDLLEASNYEVQDLKVCLKYIQKESYVKSNKAVVEVHLPSGLVVNDNAVRDLSSGSEMKNTMRAFDGSAMYVYYNTVGTNEVCFRVTAHRQFKIAMHRPAYVVVYDTEARDRFALKTYEGKVLQVCDICENEDCKTLRC